MQIKAGYKRTAVGIIPEEWDISMCSDLSDRITVGIVIRPKQYYVNHGVPAFRSANIRESGITDNDLVFISEKSNALLKKSQAKAGDVLTVRTGYPGTSAVVLPRHSGSNCIDILITSPSSTKLDSNYLAIWVNSTFGKEQVLRNQGGNAQQHFNVSDMRNLLIALPTLPEQRAIAQALNDVDALIAALDRLIAKKRDIKQATMQQLLTGKTRLPGFTGKWEAKKLGELGSTYGGLTGKTKTDFGNGLGLYVTFMNVMENVVVDCEAFEKVQVAPGENQNYVKKGDLLFNGSSETPEEVAMCSYMSAYIPNLFLNSFCFGFSIRDEQQTDGLFLAYYLRANPGRELMKSLAQGSTRYNLSKIALLEASIQLPQKTEQTAIAAVLSDMDKELSALESRRDKTRALKQGMMQELLTGKTRLI